MRQSTICSSLTTPAQVRDCCFNLKSDYDLSNAIRIASVLFFRLTGRQSKYAGTCVKTVRPWFKDGCSCLRALDYCACRMQYVYLHNACQIDQVVLNGTIVDPKLYRLDGFFLHNLSGDLWPACQNLRKDSTPLVVPKVIASGAAADPNVLTVTAQTDGTFNLSGVFPYQDDAMHLTGIDGSVWVIPTVCVSVVGPGWKVNPALATTDWQKAAMENLRRIWTDTAFFGDPVVLTKYAWKSLDYVNRPVPDALLDGYTLEITYRTGCFVPAEVRSAVATLACEVAKSQCGDESCRLPSYLRSFTLDGDAVTRIDPYTAFNEGLTGIPDVDLLIKSINPHMLRRGARLLHGGLKSGLYRK